jgi:DtxR family Mn-dependent transcriptional regulator
MFYIRAEEGGVRAARLAEWLGVSPPTVSEALHRLERDGLVELGTGHALTFTEAGESAAGAVVRRHRIVEVWLTEALGFDWVSADDEAHRIAHTLSEEVLERLHASLGRPRVCPHGNPIPGEPESTDVAVKLAQLEPGEEGAVRRISEVAEHESPQLLGVLEQAGLRPGIRVLVLTPPLDGWVALSVQGRDQVRLPAPAADAVWVEGVRGG